MAQIQSQQYHDDMEDPPARLVPHEIFQHITSRVYVRVRRQGISQKDVLSTSLALRNLSCAINFLSPYASPFNGSTEIKSYSSYYHVRDECKGLTVGVQQDLLLSERLQKSPGGDKVCLFL